MQHDWDDLRHFLAAYRAGSLNAAAQRLGVDPATVGRRIARLETSLKATLFSRAATGLKLTAAGAQLADIAAQAESTMEAAALIGDADVAGGSVRISTSEGFGSAILAPALPALHARRPGLRIELAAQSEFLSPVKREADIAVTLSAPHAARLVVETLCDYQLGLYAAPAYLDRAGTPKRLEDLTGHTIVGYVDDLLYAPELRYLDEVHPHLRAALASSSIRAQEEIVRAGGGVAVLPCFMAAGLTRILKPKVKLERRFWLSTHRDVAETARVRQVCDWLRALVKAEARRLAPD
jgi:DNA-binding transcriptional LysR family regulator